MKKRDLIIYIPVVHEGYLSLLDRKKEDIDNIYLIGNTLLKKLSKYEPTKSVLNQKRVIQILNSLGYSNISTLEESNLNKIKEGNLLLINDEISRNLHNIYLKKSIIEWDTVFLRWDRDSVLSVIPIETEVSEDLVDINHMNAAYSQAENSSDWWRQVGAVLIKNGDTIFDAYNRGFPDDHEPYIKGALRDYLEPGEHPELSSTIHAEQLIIAKAAKDGVSIEGSALYVTHFPCSVCAKLIALSSINKCYFGEGSSNGDGKAVLESAGVDIIKVEH